MSWAAVHVDGPALVDGIVVADGDVVVTDCDDVVDVVARVVVVVVVAAADLVFDPLHAAIDTIAARTSIRLPARHERVRANAKAARLKVPVVAREFIAGPCSQTVEVRRRSEATRMVTPAR